MNKNNILKTYKAGDIIMSQGDHGDYAYIIEEGRVEIYIEKEDGEKQVFGTRGPGSMIGEMALIDSGPRTASIRAIKDCKFLIITQDDFTRRLNESDPIVRMTTEVILTRYRDTLSRALINKDRKQSAPTESVELQSAASSNAIEQVKMANELKEGFEKGQLFFQFQPIVDIQNNRLAGFESLMRWNHPERGFIRPDIFIPVAEQTGLIHEMTPWLLSEGAKAIEAVQKAAPDMVDKPFASINLSSNNFQKAALLKEAKKCIKNTDIKPEQIHLEITERVLMSNPEKTRLILEELEQDNFHISIDDFGTGYSSLSYLHNFPIHTLKIDRSFVLEMMENEKSMALIKSMIALGNNMNMSIIAEGIEHKQEVIAFKELGCDMIQGYYFSRPLNLDDLIEYAKKPIIVD